MRTLGYFPAAVSTALASLAVLSCGEIARAGTLVDFNFANFGTVQVDLFDDLTPVTVANFLSYANSGAYTNSIIHRSVPNFVIQGGGFNTQGTAIPTLAPIALEYSRANTRGTIAMARTGATSTTTATTQWFFNTVDNTQNLGPSNAGGYAVFGWVIAGMSAVDNIAALPTFAFTSPFDQMPLQNYTQTDFAGHADPTSHVVTLSSVTVIGSHPSFRNPVVVDDVNNDGTVKPLDALIVINDLLANGTHSVSGPFSGTNYLDTSGDGNVSPLDALQVINALLLSGGAAAPAMSAAAMPSPMLAPMMVVPEPSSFVLAAAGTLALAGYALRRRMR